MKPFRNKRAHLLMATSLVVGLVSLTGCGDGKKTTSMDDFDLSFLEDYAADLTDATGIGRSEEEFIKADADGNLDPVSYQSRGKLAKGKKPKLANEDSSAAATSSKQTSDPHKTNLSQDDLKAVLVEYNVYDNLTFVKYAPKFESCTFYTDEGKEYDGSDGTYGVYIDRKHVGDYSKYDIKPSISDNYYRDVIRVKNGKVTYTADSRYYSNEVYQSFVIDNETGYIYSLDFIYFYNGNGSTPPVRAEDTPDQYIEVQSNKLTLFTYDLRKENWNSFHWEITDLVLSIENDNLVIKELGAYSNMRDKYGQYYVYRDERITGRVVYPEHKTLAGEIVYLNDEMEAVGIDEQGLYKYGDNFVREPYSLQDGEVFEHRFAEQGKNYAYRSARGASESYRNVYSVSSIRYQSVTLYLDGDIFDISLNEYSPNDYSLGGIYVEAMGHYKGELGGNDIKGGENRGLIIANFDATSAYEDGFGQYLYVENNNLYSVSLTKWLCDDYTQEDAVLVKEGVSSINYGHFENSDDLVVVFKDNNIFGQSEYYLFLTEEGYDIVLAKEYVATPRTYILTPINLKRGQEGSDE